MIYAKRSLMDFKDRKAGTNGVDYSLLLANVKAAFLTLKKQHIKKAG